MPFACRVHSDLLGERAIVSRLVMMEIVGWSMSNVTKEIRMKSKKLVAVVLNSVIVLALSLSVMGQSTTQSTTTTSQDPAALAQPQTTQTTDTTITPAAPQVKQTDTTTTTTTPQPQVKQTDTTTTTTAPPPEVKTDTTSTTSTTPQQQ
jgi:Tfp pilus assembly protein PilV